MGMGSEEEITPPMTLEEMMERAKFYTSLCLGTTAILSVFGFLFLIPFIVDPAISTILADYESTAVVCKTFQHIYAEGMSNCSWASCREGCTNAPLRCHMIYANYSKMPYAEFKKAGEVIDNVEWELGESRLFINTEGCGYPPRVNCSNFAKEFGPQGGTYPCYYSRVYPDTVVTRYSWEDNLKYLIISLIVPNVLFAVSIGVLSYWYCPGCNRARCSIDNTSYGEKFNSKEEEEEEDEEEEEEEY